MPSIGMATAVTASKFSDANISSVAEISERWATNSDGVAIAIAIAAGCCLSIPARQVYR